MGCSLPWPCADPNQPSPRVCWPPLGLGTSWCHLMSPRSLWQQDGCWQLVGLQRILARPRVGTVPAGSVQLEVASSCPRGWTWAGTCGWGVRLLGLIAAPPAGQLPQTSPRVRSSLPAAAALANSTVLARPASAAGSRVSLLSAVSLPASPPGAKQHRVR